MKAWGLLVEKVPATPARDADPQAGDGRFCEALLRRTQRRPSDPEAAHSNLGYGPRPIPWRSLVSRFIDELKRSHRCGELRASDIGQEVVLFGWVANRRDHGGLIFIDLRDRDGITQIVFDPDEKAAHVLAEATRPEWVIGVRGVVRSRGESSARRKASSSARRTPSSRRARSRSS